MKRAAAYSLVELSVSIAIVGVVSAICLPGISTLLRINQLEGDVSTIAECINVAQRHAAAPGPSDGPFRYAAVQLTHSPTDSSQLYCQPQAFGGSAMDDGTAWANGGPFGSFAAAGITRYALGRMTLVSQAGLTLARLSVSAAGMTVTQPYSVELYFDAKRLGAPWAVRVCDTNVTTSCRVGDVTNPQVTVALSLARGTDTFYLSLPKQGGLTQVATIAPQGW